MGRGGPPSETARKAHVSRACASEDSSDAPKVCTPLILFFGLLLSRPRAAAFDWDPVTDAEKTMKSNPLDPGAGAVVLFKRGEVDVLEKSSLFWTTRIQTYVRIKVFTDAGREAANVSVDAPKYVRLSKIEGRTILPSGEIIPLDSSKVFRGKAYQSGKISPSCKPASRFPRSSRERLSNIKWRKMRIGFILLRGFSTPVRLGTLQSSLKVIIGPRLGMAQIPAGDHVNKISIAQIETVQGTQFDFSVKNLRPILSEPYSLALSRPGHHDNFYAHGAGFRKRCIPPHSEVGRCGHEVFQRFNKMEKSEKEAKNKAKELAEKLPDAAKESRGDLQVSPAEHYLEQSGRSESGPDCR